MPPSNSTIPPPPGGLQILHWNVHSWCDQAGEPNLESAADLLAETDPDVVSLVEVDEPWGISGVLSELASRCGYSPIFSPTFEYGSDAPAGGFGNALLTRLPILAIQQWHLTWPTTTYDGTEASETRSVLLAKLGVTSEPLWIGTTHLPRGDARARTDALDRLTSLVRRLDVPWIICGDFNVPGSSWMDDSAEMMFCPNPGEPTYPADHPIEAIDYCIASVGIATDAKVLPTRGSDHCPVLFSARIITAN